VSQNVAQQKKKPSLKQRLDIYKYDQQLQSIWRLIKEFDTVQLRLEYIEKKIMDLAQIHQEVDKK